MNKTKNLFEKAVGDIGNERAEIEEIVLVNKKQSESIKKESRDKKAVLYLRKAEHKKFLSVIGRESFSDMSRELILLAIGEKTDNPKNRRRILNLIKSKNDF